MTLIVLGGCCTFFGNDLDNISAIHRVSWVIYRGNKFIPMKCEVAFGEVNGLQEFGHLQFIWVADETVEGLPKILSLLLLTIYLFLSHCISMKQMTNALC